MEKKIKDSIIPGIILIILIIIALFFVIRMNIPKNSNNFLVENINVGESKTLKNDVENGFILWESQDENIVTVDNGIIRGISNGETIINLYVNGKLENRYKIIVQSNDIIRPTFTPTINNSTKPTPNISITPTPVSTPNTHNYSTPTPKASNNSTPQPNNNNNNNNSNNNNNNNNTSINAESIVINANKTKINIGDTLNLTTTITPNNTTNKMITWTSSNPKIASVDNGKVTAITTGTVTITAKTTNGKAATYTINIVGTLVHFISHFEAKGKDHVTGDAILLESDGHFAMIDAGNTNSTVANHITKYLKNYGVTKLDFILFTHMHSDHAGNLQNLLNSGLKISNIWIKNYDVKDYQTNYLPNFNNDGIDTGLKDQKDLDNENINLNNSLSRFKRIIYLAKYSKYKNYVSNIKYISDDKDGKTYTFKYLDFKMTLYNNKLNINTINNENYDSVISLIEVNNHRMLLTGDAYDTKQLNKISSTIGKIDVLKLPHHGSRNCALLDKKYTGDKVDNSGKNVSSTSLNSLKPTYFIITSSKKKIDNIRQEYNVSSGNMCVDKISSYQNKYKFYVDETSNSLIVDLTKDKITFIKK